MNRGWRRTDRVPKYELIWTGRMARGEATPWITIISIYLLLRHGVACTALPIHAYIWLALAIAAAFDRRMGDAQPVSYLSRLKCCGEVIGVIMHADCGPPPPPQWITGPKCAEDGPSAKASRCGAASISILLHRLQRTLWHKHIFFS